VFSIVTPNLNGLPYLRACAGSVRGQWPERYEHIIRDAKSTDGSQAWLAAQDDLSVTVAADGGMYAAIQDGWSEARGEILSWLNSDEQYLPDTLRHVRETFAARPGVDVVWGDCVVVDAGLQPIAWRREVPLRISYLARGNLYAMSCTMFFRRGLLQDGRLRFDQRFRTAADYNLVLDLLKGGVAFHHLRMPLAVFTVTGRNLSRHPVASEEIEAIRSEHGLGHSLLRQTGARSARILERFASGSYLPRRASLRLATDEVPSYETHDRWLPGTFRY